MKDPLLMTTGAAQILKKSAATTRGYVRDGILRAIRTTSGVRLFRESDVRELARKLALQKAQRVESQPESIDLE
jgi:DNA-binding transcriptional MerR regulator